MARQIILLLYTYWSASTTIKYCNIIVLIVLLVLIVLIVVIDVNRVLFVLLLNFVRGIVVLATPRDAVQPIVPTMIINCCATCITNTLDHPLGAVCKHPPYTPHTFAPHLAWVERQAYLVLL